MVHCLGGFVPENDEGVLVHDEGVGEHVAPRDIAMKIHIVSFVFLTIFLFVTSPRTEQP